MDNTTLYSPCPCGSGKKHKFCCRRKERERKTSEYNPELRLLSSDTDLNDKDTDQILVGDMDGGSRFFEKGLRLMGRGDYEKAIPWFCKASEAVPFIYNPCNNLALCLFVTGKLDDAIRAQRKGLDASPLPNPFGLCNLANFMLIEGDVDEAERCLEEALGMEIPSADACVKLCETLARFNRHQDIIDVAQKSDYSGDSGVCFFAGVAAANLGLRKRALDYLRGAAYGHPKADMASRYIQHLKEGSSPHTVMGDWPYLMFHEICPPDVAASQIKKDEISWLAGRVAADFCEALLNENASDPDKAIDLLCSLTHPDVKTLLWAVVEGTFGPDELRIRALQSLEDRGEVDRKKSIKMFIRCKRREVLFRGLSLNPEIRFGKKLPPDLDRLYTKTVKASSKSNANWDKLGRVYHRIMKEEPDYYPARYNYAVSLLHRKRQEEAEPILREITASYPDYLFAPATLLQILVRNERYEEAEELVKSVELPEETHPDAMAAWMAAQTEFFVSQEKPEEAAACLGTLVKLNPDHPMINIMSERIKGIGVTHKRRTS